MFKNTIGIFLLIQCIYIPSIQAQNIDINILKHINNERNRSLDPMFKTITNTAAPVSLILPVSMFTASMYNKDEQLKNNALFVGSSFIAASVLTLSMKYLINRKRPFETYPFIEKETAAGSPSFPSGHTAAAFATATAISMAYPEWYVIAPSFLWAGAVGYSRMHLGVHYPSDVLVGALTGFAASLICRQLKLNIH